MSVIIYRKFASHRTVRIDRYASSGIVITQSIENTLIIRWVYWYTQKVCGNGVYNIREAASLRRRPDGARSRRHVACCWAKLISWFYCVCVRHMALLYKILYRLNDWVYRYWNNVANCCVRDLFADVCSMAIGKREITNK